MKKDAKLGLLALPLWAVLLTLLVLAFRGELPDSPGDLLRMLSYAALLLLAVFYVLLFLASKGKRLRLLLFPAAGLGLVLNRPNLFGNARIPAVLGIVVLYILVCSYRNFRRLQEALRPLNEAVLAYRKDHDGEKCLAALDRCAGLPVNVGVFKRPDTGTVTYQEHILCEKIQVLGDMGRLEEGRAVIARLRQETKRPDLLRWLEEKEAEFSAGFGPED